MHESAIDLYTKRVQKAISEIPQGFLQLDTRASLVVTNVDTHNPTRPGIFLACGYHFQDLSPSNVDGLTICVNTPGDGNHVAALEGKVQQVIIPIGEPMASFETGNHRFMLNAECIDLDTVVCYDLCTGKKYEKQKSQDAQDLDIPF